MKVKCHSNCMHSVNEACILEDTIEIYQKMGYGYPVCCSYSPKPSSQVDSL